MDMIGNKIDVIIFGKTKLDGFFPRGQFKIPGFKQRYGLDLNARSGGLMVLIYGNISLKTLNRIDIASDMHTKKWLLLPVCRRSHQNPMYFKDNLQRVIDFFLSTYDNVLKIGDFNIVENEAVICSIMEDNGLANLIKSL